MQGSYLDETEKKSKSMEVHRHLSEVIKLILKKREPKVLLTEDVCIRDLYDLM